MSDTGAGTCLELALEGERLCKSGDFQAGVTYFEAAVKVGTTDERTLSAIYSQLGNAYFYLADYSKALSYHQHDLRLAKSMGDKSGEAKASGNLGNTWKMKGDFDEAIKFCSKHQKIAQELGDKVGEGRALYNLGNVYHTRAKALAKRTNDDPGHLPENVQCFLQHAVECYEANLELMIELQDKSAQGRALGNLGNSHYLLGNFNQAVDYHKQRWTIAHEFGDRAGERRADCNLGNAHIFLGNFETAASYYKKTLAAAVELGDRVIEAQACYSLGNTYTLLREYKTAISYHLRHLKLAQELRDQVGQGRAYWSLSNASSALGDHREALVYAGQHLSASKRVNDKDGEAAAEKSINELRKILAHSSDADEEMQSAVGSSTPTSSCRSKRSSMQKMELLKLTPSETLDEAFASNTQLHLVPEEAIPSSSSNKAPRTAEQDSFWDMLAKVQGGRMDDQRCTFDPCENKENRRPPPPKMGLRTRRNPMHRSASQPANDPVVGASNQRHDSESRGGSIRRSSIPGGNENPGFSGSGSNTTATNSSENCRAEDLFDMIAGLQSQRMDEQRAAMPCRSATSNGPESLPGHDRGHGGRGLHRMSTLSGELQPQNHRSRQMSVGANVLPDDDFFEMLMRCQASRLEDQRSELPTMDDANVITSRRQTSDTSMRTESTTLSLSSQAPNRPVEAELEAEQRVETEAAPSTVPDDDFFSLILRFQAGRIDDQRSQLQPRSAMDPSDAEMRRESSRSSSGSSGKQSTQSTNRFQNRNNNLSKK